MKKKINVLKNVQNKALKNRKKLLKKKKKTWMVCFFKHFEE